MAWEFYMEHVVLAALVARAVGAVVAAGDEDGDTAEPRLLELHIHTSDVLGRVNAEKGA